MNIKRKGLQNNFFEDDCFFGSIAMSTSRQGKGMRLALKKGVVIHAAAKVAGGRPEPCEWRTLNFSEGTWQAHGKLPTKKCDARYGRKFRLARSRKIWKRSAST